MSLADAAKRVRRDERTLRRWAAAGLRVVEVAGIRYVELRAVTAWAATHGRRRGRSR